ncbi:ABC-type transport auxiliary lipoprotein family protein [Marinilabilia sp.]
MKHTLFFIFASILIFSAGCGSQKTVVKKYYMIEEPDSMINAKPDSSKMIDAWCEVDEVKVYPAFASRQIVLRDASHQIRYFGNHEWAVRPTEILTPLIIDYLSTHLVFKRVADRFWEVAPDYRLKTTIFKLELGTIKKKKFEARLRIRFELIDTKTDTIIASHNVARNSILEKNDLNLWASAISRMLHEELSDFSEQIRTALPGNK